MAKPLSLNKSSLHVKKTSKFKFFNICKQVGLLVDLNDINMFYNNLNDDNAYKAIPILYMVKDMKLWSRFHVNHVTKVM
jgi:hypothetical protein